MIALDAHGTVHAWNRAAEQMFGWAAADTVGGPLPFEVGDVVPRVMARAQIAPKRAQYARRDGARLDVEVRCGPLEDDSGRTVGAVLVLTDVSAEQRTSERDLEETRAALARAEELHRPPPYDDLPVRSVEADGDALLDAITGDQLELFFQPVVRLADAQCVGAEALVRWADPDRGLVSADAIFALAEECDLSDELGAWILERAITQAARWQLEQSELRAAVKLPTRALAQAGLPVLVRDLLRREGVAPESIDVQVASFALTDDVIRPAVEDLRDAGVQIFVEPGDSAGVNVDGIKGDCSVVDQASVDDAHARGLRVIAANVESEPQLWTLLLSGCDEAQGNFFAPPQPASDLRTLLSPARRWRPPGSHLMRRA
jgi:PAS domain S-box-containing protein